MKGLLDVMSTGGRRKMKRQRHIRCLCPHEQETGTGSAKKKSSTGALTSLPGLSLLSVIFTVVGERLLSSHHRWG